MLPLTTCLLIACNLQSKFSLQNHKFRFWLAALLGCILFTQTGIFAQRTIACQDFPTQQQDVNPQWKLMSNWIRTHTPEDSLIIS